MSISNFRKKYPNQQTRLSKFNSAKAATYEIAIRLSSFREKIFFHEDFGAGKDYIGDGTSLYLKHVLQAKLSVHSYNDSGPSQGIFWNDLWNFEGYPS